MNQQPIKRRSFFASLAALPFLAFFFGKKAAEAAPSLSPQQRMLFRQEYGEWLDIYINQPAEPEQQYPDDPIFNAILRIVDKWYVESPRTITYRGSVVFERMRLNAKASALLIYNEIMTTAIDCCGGSDYSMQINEHGFAEYMANSAVYHGEDRQG